MASGTVEAPAVGKNQRTFPRKQWDGALLPSHVVLAGGG